MAQSSGTRGERTPSPSVATLPPAGSASPKPAEPLKGSASAESEALAKAKAKKELEDALQCDDERRRLIEESAYYRARRRGFEPGHEEEDWLEAEKEVDRNMPK